MLPTLSLDERRLLELIASHQVVQVPLLKPVTDELEAKHLIFVDEGMLRITNTGQAVMARACVGSPDRLHLVASTTRQADAEAVR